MITFYININWKAYICKGGIAFTGILLPSNATPRVYRPLYPMERCWARVKNAQLARDIEVGIPKEILKTEWANMMNEYCKSNFVDKGMIADYCIHDKKHGLQVALLNHLKLMLPIE